MRVTVHVNFKDFGVSGFCCNGRLLKHLKQSERLKTKKKEKKKSFSAGAKTKQLFFISILHLLETRLEFRRITLPNLHFFNSALCQAGGNVTEELHKSPFKCFQMKSTWQKKRESLVDLEPPDSEKANKRRRRGGAKASWQEDNVSLCISVTSCKSAGRRELL